MTNNKKLLSVLREEAEKHHVFAFGRMNPPTTGHEKLVSKVHEIADKHKAGHSVVLSHSQDSEKNPLSAAEKLKHAKRFFPKTNLSAASKSEPNFLHHVAKLHKAGVTHLHVVAGSDRIPEYKKVLHKYNGSHKEALFNFKKVQVHSAGERDPDAHGTEGMSASKMRAHAASGNYKEFKKGVPAHVHNHHAHEMFNDVRHGMGLKEHLEEGKLYIPSNSALPLPRGAMPQITRAERGSFRNHMASLGIRSSFESVPAKSLRATQAEFSPEKIKKIMTNTSYDHDPIMVSKDDYVLDGHHRWLATYNKDIDSHQPILRFSAHIHDLLPAAKKFPKAQFKGVHEEYNRTEGQLSEGLHDPGIFKAVFLAGGPGSGKDFILKRVMSSFGFVEVSSDPFLSYMMKTAKLDLKMPEHESAQRDQVRSRAKQLEQHKKELVIRGRLGIIVNGVADDYSEIAQKKRELEEIGYDTFMVFVNVSDEESKKRNIARGESGGRTVPEPIRSKKWQGAQNVMREYHGLFGRNYVIIDNSADINSAPVSERAKLESEIQGAFKKIRAFTATKPSSHPALQWIHMQHSAPTTAKFSEEISEEDTLLDRAFADHITTLLSEGYGQYSTSHTAQNTHVVRRLGVRHGRGKTPGAQWSLHHRASDTANPPPKIPAPKPLKALRREATADTFAYDFDTTMGSTAPIGSNPPQQAKGYIPWGGARYEDENDAVKKKNKKKPLSKIIKENNKYNTHHRILLENTDDLLSDNKDE